MTADEFVLGDALLVPEIDRIEFERVVPARKSVMPFFWVWGTDFDEFEYEAETEPEISKLVHVDSFEDGRLYRAEWSQYVSGLVRGIKQCDAVLLSGTGEKDHWEFEIRFPNKDDLTDFSSQCIEKELELSLERMHMVSPPSNDRDIGYGLTPRQRELLTEAAKNGYYEEPRAVSLQELAEDFDISAASATGLLRRGTHQLIDSTILQER
ncbi:helix-turn-helix domain-containing protein [Natrarchaeobius chitinivorans]|nr:helix-turn-helix domain-containing protein [Natrarchaeobius chitinivorans]